MTEMPVLLKYLTNLVVNQDTESPDLRGVTVFWREKDHNAWPPSTILMVRSLMK